MANKNMGVESDHYVSDTWEPILQVVKPWKSKGVFLIHDPIIKHFRYLKWRNPHLHKLYGYGLCKRKAIPKIAEYKVQETLHFRSLKFWRKNR